VPLRSDLTGLVDVAVLNEPKLKRIRLVRSTTASSIYVTSWRSLTRVKAKVWNTLYKFQQDAALGLINPCAHACEPAEAAREFGRSLEASGRMDRQTLESHWAGAYADYERYRQLCEQGPSERWGNSSSPDIIALKDEAGAKMLEVSAPNLAAVVTKLSVLWSDDRFDPVFTSTGHARILRDLHRLATSQHQ
jgi:hypothetical protein